MYTSPSDKLYIGQTINEENRKRVFNQINLNYCTGGTSAIDNARIRYSPENFKYEILFTQEFKTKQEAKLELDYKEIEYIEKYDSYNNGYNATKGGKSRIGFKWSEEQRKNISGENHHGYNKPGPNLGKELVKKQKSIDMFDLNNNFIRSFKSINEASEYLKIDKSNICKVLKGKLKKSKGHIFKYKQKQTTNN